MMILTIHYQLVKVKGWTPRFPCYFFGIDRSKPAPWYYLDPTTGIMQTGYKHGNKWYYLRSSGAMATGWYQKVPLGII